MNNRQHTHSFLLLLLLLLFHSFSWTASSCVNLERVGAGCSTGGCGGYTPSGWNKLQIIHCLQCEDPDCPCCCCPPCSCSEQCPGPCPCCPCPCCPCPCQETKRAPPSRKYKTYNLSCNSKPAGQFFRVGVVLLMLLILQQLLQQLLLLGRSLSFCWCY